MNNNITTNARRSMTSRTFCQQTQLNSASVLHKKWHHHIAFPDTTEKERDARMLQKKSANNHHDSLPSHDDVIKTSTVTLAQSLTESTYTLDATDLRVNSFKLFSSSSRSGSKPFFRSFSSTAKHKKNVTHVNQGKGAWLMRQVGGAYQDIRLPC